MDNRLRWIDIACALENSLFLLRMIALGSGLELPISDDVRSLVAGSKSMSYT